MKMDNYLVECMKIFYNSFINYHNELIIIPKGNIYFCLDNVENEFDLKCKIIEFVSRPASKGIPYQAEWRNKKYRKEALDNINKYLNTNFSKDDIELIYAYLGGRCNHKLTEQFVKSNYDMNLLK